MRRAASQHHTSGGLDDHEAAKLDRADLAGWRFHQRKAVASGVPP